jgi:hypothetical protein
MAWVNDQMPATLAIVPLFGFTTPEVDALLSDYEGFEEFEPSAEEKVWHWLGGHVPKLEPVVETYLHGTTDKQRLQAFNKLDKYRRKKSEGRWSGAKALSYDDDKVLGGRDANKHGDGDDAYIGGHKRRDLVFGGLGVEMSETSVSRKLTGRRDRPRDRVAADPDSVRAFLEGWATSQGTTLEALAAPTKPGRPSEPERARIRKLGGAVSAARDQGFTQEGDRHGNRARQAARQRTPTTRGWLVPGSV